MTEYITAFRDNGLLLRSLVDFAPEMAANDALRSRSHEVLPLVVIELIKT